ncbi:MAG: hypothetical protein IJR47_05405, partial [Clostridia bacterium]|nr:hypothetical protein [Clostridia bacterium]
MVGLEIENVILRQSLKDELLNSGYMVFEQGNRLLDLTVVQGERCIEGISPCRVLLLTENESHPLINNC